MSELTPAIVTYCAEEVGRQYAYSDDAQTAARAVGWMVDAWVWAMRKREWGHVVTLKTIEKLGEIVEPGRNARGIRRVGVRVGDHVCPSPSDVPRLLSRWVDMQTAMTASEAYKEYELIHPFVDGNGRTGKILFNWLGGTLDAPTMPPNFWGCANP
jgi:hypothetical protein